MVGWTRRNRESRERWARHMRWYRSLTPEARAKYDAKSAEEEKRATAVILALMAVLLFLVFLLFQLSDAPAAGEKSRKSHVHVMP